MRAGWLYRSSSTLLRAGREDARGSRVKGGHVQEDESKDIFLCNHEAYLYG